MMKLNLILFLNKLGFEFVIEDGKITNILYNKKK